MAIFARIGTIKGESVDARHRDEIDVLGWNWGVAQAPSGPGGGGTGAGAGKPVVHELSFTHRLDRSTPLLLKACLTGQHLKDAAISVRSSGGNQQDYLVLRLTDVLVTSVLTAVVDEGDGTQESVTLAFGRVDLDYKPQKPNGSLGSAVHFGYDLRSGKTS